MAESSDKQRQDLIDLMQPLRGRKAVEQRFGFITEFPKKPQQEQAKYPTVEAFEKGEEYKEFEAQKGKFLAGRAYRELVETEIQYLNDLFVLSAQKQEIIAAYEKIKNKQYTDKAEVKKLLGLWEAILTGQKKLMHSLTNEGPAQWAAQAEALEKFYIDYALQFEKVKSLPLDVTSASSDTAALFNIFKQPQFQNLNIGAFTIKPIQRILKYNLLLREMKKNLSADHPEFQALALAEEKFNQVAERINHQKRLSEERALAQNLVAAFNQNKEQADKKLPEILNLLAKSALGEEELKTLLISPLKKEYLSPDWLRLFKKAFEHLPSTDPKRQVFFELLKAHFPAVAMEAVLAAGLDVELETGAKQPAQHEATTPKQAAGVRIMIRVKTDKERLKSQLQTSAKAWGENFTVVPVTGKTAIEDKLGVGRRIKNFAQGRTQFLIKSPQGKNLFRINLYEDYVSIKVVPDKEGRITSSADMMQKMHAIVKQISMVAPISPKIYSTDVAALTRLQTLDVNESQQVTYQLSKQTRQALNADQKALTTQLEAAVAPTVKKELKSTHEIVIDYNPKNVRADVKKMEQLHGLDSRQMDSDAIKHKFESVIKNGFVPRLNNQQVPQTLAQYNKQGNFSGEIAVHVRNPILALKQYENILAAGFTPRFEPAAKEAVTKYVHIQARKNHTQFQKNPATENEKQISVSGVPDEKGFINGEMVLKRILVAANDGLSVTLDSQAAMALQRYVLDQKILEQRFSLPRPVSLSDAMNVIHLAAMGILPAENLSAEDLKTLRTHLHELKTLAEKTPIDSGHIVQDLKALQAGYAMGVALSVKNNAELLKHTGQLAQALTIDVKNLPIDEQMAQVKYLAQAGMAAQVSPSLKKSAEPIAITSENAQHALSIFQTLLTQNFIPSFETKTAERVRGLLKDSLQEVILSAEKPEVLISQIQLCFAQGLVPKLNAKQEQTLKTYVQMQPNLTLELAGFNGEAVRTNMRQAQHWGIFIKLKEKALGAYQKERQAKETFSAPYAVEVMPVYRSQRSWLFFTRQEVDKEKTLALINHLLEQRVNVALTDEVKKLRTDDERKKDKKLFFFFGPLTQEAKQARKFIAEIGKVEAKQQENQRTFMNQSSETYHLADLDSPLLGQNRPQITPMRETQATIPAQKEGIAQQAGISAKPPTRKLNKSS